MNQLHLTALFSALHLTEQWHFTWVNLILIKCYLALHWVKCYLALDQVLLGTSLHVVRAFWCFYGGSCCRCGGAGDGSAVVSQSKPKIGGIFLNTLQSTWNTWWIRCVRESTWAKLDNRDCSVVVVCWRKAPGFKRERGVVVWGGVASGLSVKKVFPAFKACLHCPTVCILNTACYMECWWNATWDSVYCLLYVVMVERCLRHSVHDWFVLCRWNAARQSTCCLLWRVLVERCLTQLVLVLCRWKHCLTQFVYQLVLVLCWWWRWWFPMHAAVHHKIISHLLAHVLACCSVLTELMETMNHIM